MKPTNSDLSPQYNTHTHSLSLSWAKSDQTQGWWSLLVAYFWGCCLLLGLCLWAMFCWVSLSLSLPPFSSCVEIWWNFFVLMGFLVEIWAVFGFFPAGLRLAKWRSRLGIGLWRWFWWVLVLVYFWSCVNGF